MMENSEPNIEPGVTPPEGPEQNRRPRNGLQDLLKSLITVVLLIAVIVGCFLISFYLGKRILSPARKVPQQVEMAVKEQLPSAAHLKKLAEMASLEAAQLAGTKEAKTKIRTVTATGEVKTLAKAQLPAIANKAVVTPEAKVAQVDKKIVAPVAKSVAVITQPAKSKTSIKPTKTATKTSAVAKPGAWYKLQAGLFASKSAADSLTSCLMKVGQNWRVQAGAFKTKARALAQQSTLKAKGFSAAIIYE
jgi:cytoskeletal protein RodZ